MNRWPLLLLLAAGCAEPTGARVSAELQLPQRNAQLVAFLEAELTATGPGDWEVLRAIPRPDRTVVFPEVEITPGDWMFTLEVASTLHGVTLVTATADATLRAGVNDPVVFTDFATPSGDGDTDSDWAEFWAGCNPSQPGCGPAVPFFDPPSGSVIGDDQPIRVGFARDMDTSAMVTIGGSLAAVNPPTETWSQDTRTLELRTSVGNPWPMGTRDITVEAIDQAGVRSETRGATYDVRAPVGVTLSPSGNDLAPNESIVLIFDQDMNTEFVDGPGGSLASEAVLTWQDVRTLELSPSDEWPLGSQDLQLAAFTQSANQRVETDVIFEVANLAVGVASVVPTESTPLLGFEQVVVTFSSPIVPQTLVIGGDLGGERGGNTLSPDNLQLTISPPGGGWSESAAASLVIQATLSDGSSTEINQQLVYPVDRTDPTLMSSSPTDTDRMTADDDISLTYSEPIGSVTIVGGLLDVVGVSAIVEGGAGGSAGVIIFSPPGGWPTGPQGDISIRVTDVAGRISNDTVTFDVAPNGEIVVYVDSVTGVMGTQGTSTSPLLTVSGAYDFISALDGGSGGFTLAEIRVAGGVYTGFLANLASPLLLSGGYDRNDWTFPPQLLGTNQTTLDSAVPGTIIVTSGTVDLRRLVIRNSASSGGDAVAVSSSSATVSIDDCVLTGGGGNLSGGVFATQTNLSVTNSFVNGGGGFDVYGIRLDSSEATILNNLIDAYSAIASGTTGVWGDAGSNRYGIANNTIRAAGGTGTNAVLLFEASTDADITNNILISDNTISVCVSVAGDRDLNNLRNNAFVTCQDLYVDATTTATNITDSVSTVVGGTVSLDSRFNIDPATSVSQLFMAHTDGTAVEVNDWRLVDCSPVETNHEVCTGGDEGTQTPFDRCGAQRRTVDPAIGALESPDPT